MRPVMRIIRRVRRAGITSPLSFLSSIFNSTSEQAKHIKIDDEERQASDSIPSIRQSQRRISRMLLLLLLLTLLFLLLLAYTIYKPPHALVLFLQWRYPNVLWHVPLPPASRVVALTIDDAPSSHTVQILALLKAYSAKATFFVIGSQIEDYPELLQQIHDEGHEIGNHAWRDEPSINLPLSELERQIKDVEALIPANEGGQKYFRPGSGFFNKKMIAKAKEMGYRVVLGSIYPHDPQIPNPVRNSKHVLSMLKPGGIVIVHDRRDYSAKQLELILKGMKEKGWTAASLSGLLKVGEVMEGKKSG